MNVRREDTGNPDPPRRPFIYPATAVPNRIATLALNGAPDTRRLPGIIILLIGGLPVQRLHLIRAPEIRGPPHHCGLQSRRLWSRTSGSNARAHLWRRRNPRARITDSHAGTCSGQPGLAALMAFLQRGTNAPAPAIHAVQPSAADHGPKSEARPPFGRRPTGHPTAH